MRKFIINANTIVKNVTIDFSSKAISIPNLMEYEINITAEHIKLIGFKIPRTFNIALINNAVRPMIWQIFIFLFIFFPF